MKSRLREPSLKFLKSTTTSHSSNTRFLPWAGAGDEALLVAAVVVPGVNATVLEGAGETLPVGVAEPGVHEREEVFF